MVSTPEASGNVLKTIDTNSEPLTKRTRDLVLIVSTAWLHTVQAGIVEGAGQDAGTKFVPVFKSMLEGPYKDDIQKALDAFCEEYAKVPGSEIPVQVQVAGSKLENLMKFLLLEPLSKLPGLSRPDMAFNLKFPISPRTESSA